MIDFQTALEQSWHYSHGKMCDYCGCESKLVQGDVIYPHRPDLYSKFFYMCDNKEHELAYVGCHGDSQNPHGRLADSKLRKAKQRAHKAFDVLWKEKHMSRKGAYNWLAGRLGIPVEKCHIGMFDDITCGVVVAIATDKRIKMGL